MSTGDVRRPSLNKLVNKAAATDKPDPDVIDEDDLVEDVDDLAEDDSDESEAPPKTSPAKASKAPVKKAAPARSKPAQAKSARPAASAAPAKSAAPSKAAARTSATPSKAVRQPAGRPGGRGPVRAGGGKGRKPTAPIRVRQGMNWGPIAMFSAAGVVAIAIIAFGAVAVFKQEHKTPWQDRAAAIQGIHNYLKTNPDWFKVPTEGNHKAGILTYPTSPPVGGIHNPQWQNCMGDVYDSEIAKEQATHSMEHGAVWIAYRPDLPKDQVDKLASKVRNQTFMLMSPYPGLDAPISLQAWGYQLKLDNANDSRIDAFIDALRQNATQEPQAGCSGGITDATPTPLDMTPLPTA
jgi:hypothetical protein